MQKLEQESIKQFDVWAGLHDLFYLPFLFLNKKIVKIINPRIGSSLLDIGCGWGILLKELSLTNKKLKLCGIDISPKMVGIAQSKFSIADKVEIKGGSADKLLYKNNSFECVTCILSFHHHPNSLNSLKEMYRVLKPGGRLFLLDPFIGDVITKLANAVNAVVFNESDVHLYTEEQMCGMVEEVGFENVQQQKHNLYHLLTIGEKK